MIVSDILFEQGLYSVVEVPSSILTPQGNPYPSKFEVYDKQGNLRKTFDGPSAEKRARVWADTNIKPRIKSKTSDTDLKKTTSDLQKPTSKPETTPDLQKPTSKPETKLPEKENFKSKIKGKIKRLLSIQGLGFLSALYDFNYIWAKINDHRIAYVCAGCKDNNICRAIREEIYRDLAEMTQNALISMISNAVLATRFARLLGLSGGPFGWLGSLAAAGMGYGLSRALTAISNDQSMIKPLTDYLFHPVFNFNTYKSFATSECNNLVKRNGKIYIGNEEFECDLFNKLADKYLVGESITEDKEVDDAKIANQRFFKNNPGIYALVKKAEAKLKS